MDITDALAPTSDQLDAVELVNPRTFTIAAGGRLGTRDGKTVAEIALVDFPRVWRPSRGMLDVLARCWGTDAKAWVGRSVTLYNDPEVTFGKDKVGGIRISHLSHIDGPVTVPIRGRGQGARKIMWPVKPLVEQAPAPAVEAPTAEPMTAETRYRFFALFDEVHPTPKTSRQQAQLDYIGEALFGKGSAPAPSLSVVTEAQLQHVVAQLEAEKAQQASEQLPVDEQGAQS